MQYQVDLEKLVKIALTEDEIQNDMQQANIKTELLTSKILEKSSDILEAGANEIAELNNLKNKLQSEEDELKRVKQHLPNKLILIFLEDFKIGYFKIGYFGAGALVLIAIGYFVSKYLLPTEFGWLVSALPSIFAFVASAEISLLVFYLWVKGIYTTYSDRIETAKKEELEIIELKKRIKLAEQTVEERVVKKGILPELRLLISMRLTPSYDTSLKSLKHEGLAESFDPEYEISTRSNEKLKRLFNSITHGSIGIAGPRGAGKTTLLSSFCRSTEKRFKNKQVLSVMTSAPVEYEARDFILHIFTLVCKQVLLTSKYGSPKSPWSYINRFQNPLIGTFPFFLTLRKKKSAMAILFFIGLFLTVLSVYRLDFINAIDTLKNWLGVPAFDVIFLCGLFFIGLVFFLFFIVPILFTWYSRYRSESENRYSEKISSYEDKSSGNIYEVAQKWLMEIKFQSSYSSGWSGSLKIPIAEGGINAAASLSEKQLSLPEIITGYQDFIKSVTEEKYIVIIGIDELDKLPSDEKAHRFLNEIKGIFGLKNCFYLISVSESAMSSFNRRGLPFRDVFDSSFDDIIHVDYLSFEEAEKLIKKRVIGVPIPFVSFCYCFSSGLARDLIRTCRNLFELVEQKLEESLFSWGKVPETDSERFLRFLRDDLDIGWAENAKIVKSDDGKTLRIFKDEKSAEIKLDEVNEKAILKISDGRTRVLNVKKENGELNIYPVDISLPTLCSSLIRTEIASKLHAVSAAAKDINLEPDLTKLVEELNKIGESLNSPHSLFECCSDLLHDVTSISAQQQETKEILTKPNKLASLREEFGSYLYYAVTVQEFFCEGIDEETFKKDECSIALGQLARARQDLAISPKIARSKITSFRSSHKMKSL